MKFISTLIPIVSLYQMSERKRVQWAVIGWLCKISNSLGNLCIKLTLAYCLECVWCKNSAVCFLIFILQLSLCRYQHIWRGQGLRLQKPECFVCYTKRYVQYNISHFIFRYWKHDWGRIHFSEFIWVFEFWDALGTLGFSVFCHFIRVTSLVWPTLYHFNFPKFEPHLCKK